MDRETIDLLLKDEICAICQETLGLDSRVLPCQHTFCVTCLQNLVLKTGELRCPSCRKVFFILPADLPPNITLRRLIFAKLKLDEEQREAEKVEQQEEDRRRRKIIQPETGQESSKLLIQPSTVPRQTPSPGLLTAKARALYTFKSEDHRDLSFVKGEILDLIRRRDANWYDGRLGDRCGQIPSNYIEILPGSPVRHVISTSVTTSPVIRPSPGITSIASNDVTATVVPGPFLVYPSVATSSPEPSSSLTRPAPNSAAPSVATFHVSHQTLNAHLPRQLPHPHTTSQSETLSENVPLNRTIPSSNGPCNFPTRINDISSSPAFTPSSSTSSNRNQPILNRTISEPVTTNYQPTRMHSPPISSQSQSSKYMTSCINTSHFPLSTLTHVHTSPVTTASNTASRLRLGPINPHQPRRLTSPSSPTSPTPFVPPISSSSVSILNGSANETVATSVPSSVHSPVLQCHSAAVDRVNGETLTKPSSHSRQKQRVYLKAIVDFCHVDNLPTDTAEDGNRFLFFKKDDVIQLIHTITPDWAYGRIDRRQGLFPLSYVCQHIPSTSNPLQHSTDIPSSPTPLSTPREDNPETSRAGQTEDSFQGGPMTSSSSLRQPADGGETDQTTRNPPPSPVLTIDTSLSRQPIAINQEHSSPLSLANHNQARDMETLSTSMSEKMHSLQSNVNNPASCSDVSHHRLDDSPSNQPANRIAAHSECSHTTMSLLDCDIDQLPVHLRQQQKSGMEPSASNTSSACCHSKANDSDSDCSSSATFQVYRPDPNPSRSHRINETNPSTSSVPGETNSCHRDNDGGHSCVVGGHPRTALVNNVGVSTSGIAPDVQEPPGVLLHHHPVTTSRPAEGQRCCDATENHNHVVYTNVTQYAQQTRPVSPRHPIPSQDQPPQDDEVFFPPPVSRSVSIPTHPCPVPTHPTSRTLPRVPPPFEEVYPDAHHHNSSTLPRQPQPDNPANQSQGNSYAIITPRDLLRCRHGALCPHRGYNHVMKNGVVAAFSATPSSNSVVVSMAPNTSSTQQQQQHRQVLTSSGGQEVVRHHGEGCMTSSGHHQCCMMRGGNGSGVSCSRSASDCIPRRNDHQSSTMPPQETGRPCRRAATPEAGEPCSGKKNKQKKFIGWLSTIITGHRKDGHYCHSGPTSALPSPQPKASKSKKSGHTASPPAISLRHHVHHHTHSCAASRPHQGINGAGSGIPTSNNYSGVPCQHTRQRSASSEGAEGSYSGTRMQPSGGDTEEIQVLGPKHAHIYICTHPYPASEDYELTLLAGDVIYVTEEGANGWLKGYHSHTGQLGLVPASFVQRVDEPLINSSMGHHHPIAIVNDNQAMSR